MLPFLIFSPSCLQAQAPISNKLRILIGCYQLLSLVGLCFGVEWPDEYEGAQDAQLKGTSFAPFSFTCTLPCLGFTWYASYLISTLGPTALVAVFWAVHGLITRHQAVAGSLPELSQRGSPALASRFPIGEHLP